MNIALSVCVGIIIIQAFMILWERNQAKKREDDLIAAVMANNISDYALAHSKMRETNKDRIKRIKAENELAIANQKALEGAGIPVRN